METDSNEGGVQAAPRSGAPAPFLDKEGRNLPEETSRPTWTKKQWQTRREVIDRLRFWQSEGHQCLWVTLTSSPTSPLKRLRADFQVLRKRMDRQLGFPGVEYVCVDTREGHGVLHMIWAWRDPNPAKRASFYIPFEWLQAQWKRIHGAFHVNVKRIGVADRDARRLSRYIVAQYCGGQNALVRLSQSRLPIPLGRMRAALLRTVRGLPERYEQGGQLLAAFPREEFSSVFGQVFWAEFRKAWTALVRTRSCKAFGVQLIWSDGTVQRL